ncbi:MAG: hypothetical protein NT069_14680, partial [Planctomycetota bacterium]|nr:hypothetical protein [Planctomycetota bacterium]
HPQAPMIAEAAERNPCRFGLSHNAVGRVIQRDGQFIVESIDRVHSVDIVQNPATSLGLFESENPPMTATLQELCEHARLDTLLAHPLLETLRDRTLEIADANEPRSVRAALLKGILEGIVEQIADQPDLDHPALFDHLSKQLADRSKPAPPRDLNDLLERVTKLETDAQCRTLLELHNRACDTHRLAALSALATDDARRQLIESWPSRDTAQRQRPHSSPPLHDRVEHTLKLPEDLKGFVAAVK